MTLSLCVCVCLEASEMEVLVYITSSLHADLSRAWEGMREGGE